MPTNTKFMFLKTIINRIGSCVGSEIGNDVDKTKCNISKIRFVIICAPNLSFTHIFMQMLFDNIYNIK